MNTPGVSLFQDAEVIKLGTSFQTQEKQEDLEKLEDLEEQMRRKEELGHIMENAFDDLEDDDTTNLIDKSDEAGHKQILLMQTNQFSHPYPNILNNGYGTPYHTEDHSAYEKEMHDLKMLVESRNRELEHSQHLLNVQRKRTDDFEKKLSITEAELDRALCNKKNNHELLVESKEKISDLENTIEKIHKDRKSLEVEKNELLGKLETVQTLFVDVQRKYDMVEKDLNKNQERNFEFKRKKLEDRHRAEIAILQEKMEQVCNKLDKKSSELESMSARYIALQQTHQTMLCEKASKINDISHDLDESQKRCQELLSRPDYHQENIKLQKFIASLQEQIKDMEKTINSLKKRLEVTTDEFDYMDNLLLQHNQEYTPHRLSQTQGRVVCSTAINSVDGICNLKEEFYRTIANIKSKREEIRKLQQSLEEKQTEIEYLKQEENKSLIEISTLKEENIKLQNKLKVLEEEFDKFKNCKDGRTQHEDNRVHTLHLQLKDLKSKFDIEKRNNDKFDEYKLQQEFDRKTLDVQLKNVEIDLEELKQEHDSLKLNYEQVLKENFGLKQRKTADNVGLELEKHKFLLKDAQAECDRLKNLYVEISNAKEALSYEMDKMLKADKEKELQEEKEKVANVQRLLKLAEVKCSELSRILETEKLSHEREVADLREKLEKKKLDNTKIIKDARNECAKCMDYVAQLTKFEIQNLKLTNTNAIYKKEIDELTKELKDSKENISELNRQLKLSGEQEHLIKELKTKATQFEEYIKSHSSASEASTSSMKNSRPLSDKSVTTSPELDRNEIKRIEARVRDEMSKLFAIELKRFQCKLHEAQEESACLQREYQHINSELQQRHTEVELLKHAILAEREKMDEILKQKDEEYEDVRKKQNITILKTRDELQINLQKNKELTADLKARQTQIDAERKSMKAVMKQWEEQRKSLDAVEMEWKRRFTDLQKSSESTAQSLQTKYNSAKRMAANYKRYSEDKEAHMLKEYDRLKTGYEIKLSKIQLRVKESFEKKSRELKQALGKECGLSNNNKENTASE